MNATYPAPTTEATQVAYISLPAWRAPKSFTEGELRATEDALDLAYQKKLCERVHDYVNGIDRNSATVRPARRRRAV